MSRYVELGIRSVLKPGIPPFPRKDNYGEGQVFSELAVQFLRILKWCIVAPVFLILYPILFVTQNIYTRATAKAVVKKAKSLGFGLPVALLDRWEVDASPNIGVPLFIEANFVDVSRTSLRTSQGQMDQQLPQAEQREKYGYLWDDELFRQRQSQSSWLKNLNVEPINPSSATRNGTTDNSEAKAVLTIEDRLKELVRSAELSHSAYFEDDNEIERIAAFLESDTLVEESVPIRL